MFKNEDGLIPVRGILYAVAGAALGVLLILFIGVTVTTYSTATAIRKQQVGNTKTLNYSKETLTVIKDCTKETGQCYKDGQKRIVKGVTAVTAAQVASIACADADGAQTYAQIQACVTRTMRKLTVSGD